MFRVRAGPDRQPPLRRMGGTGIDSLLFPPRCPFCRKALAETAEGNLCPDCAREIRWIGPPVCSVCGRPYPAGAGGHRCEACLRTPPFFDRALSLAAYEGPLARAIQRLKYQKEWVLTGPLAGLMSRHPWWDETYDSLIPVPLHRRRLQERGFNQAVLLGRQCRKVPADKLKPRSLQRVRHTPPQVDLRPAERERNVRGAFQIRHPRDITGKSIVLLDDVYTTGSTVNECARVLKKAGARRVSVITLARAVSP